MALYKGLRSRDPNKLFYAILALTRPSMVMFEERIRLLGVRVGSLMARDVWAAQPVGTAEVPGGEDGQAELF